MQCVDQFISSGLQWSVHKDSDCEAAGLTKPASSQIATCSYQTIFQAWPPATQTCTCGEMQSAITKCQYTLTGDIWGSNKGQTGFTDAQSTACAGAPNNCPDNNCQKKCTQNCGAGSIVNPQNCNIDKCRALDQGSINQAQCSRSFGVVPKCEAKKWIPYSCAQVTQGILGNGDDITETVYMSRFVTYVTPFTQAVKIVPFLAREFLANQFDQATIDAGCGGNKVYYGNVPWSLKTKVTFNQHYAYCQSSACALRRRKVLRSDVMSVDGTCLTQPSLHPLYYHCVLKVLILA